MRRTAINPDELLLADRAGSWLDKIEAAMDGNGWDHRRPEAGTLQRMDRELSAWRKALQRGWHDLESLHAQRRVLSWLQPMEHSLRWATYDRKPYKVVLR